jgi:hypothetical protein
MLRQELSHLEQLIKSLAHDLKYAERDLDQERKDVANAKNPPSTFWSKAGAKPRDDDEVERESAELDEAQVQAAIAQDLVAIVRSRADVVRARIEAGLTESDDTTALAHDLRGLIDIADSVAGEAQAGAIRGILQGLEGASEVFIRAQREIARARVQLALLVANLEAKNGKDDPTVASLSAIDLDIASTAPTESWRKQIANERARLVKALAPLLVADAYR